MSEEYLVKYGSPTLAGIKAGSLFLCPCESRKEAISSLSEYNRLLIGKGLCMIPLNFIRDRVLVYMFRPRLLKRDLEAAPARAILRNAGYRSNTYSGLLAELRQRVIHNRDFPHEIGLFLSYPPEDVLGFIENRASNYKCVGGWKVYGNVEEAMKISRLYERCTDAYIRKHDEGHSLSELAVPG